MDIHSYPPAPETRHLFMLANGSQILRSQAAAFSKKWAVNGANVPALSTAQGSAPDSHADLAPLPDLAHMPSMTDFRTIIERFPPPPLDEVLARIGSFETDDMEARIATIRRFVNAHAVLSYRWGAGWRYRRARRLGDQPRPDHVDGLIWRKDVPVPIGRANPAGFPMLYLADRRDTALSEVRAVDEQGECQEFRVRAGITGKKEP